MINNEVLAARQSEVIEAIDELFSLAKANELNQNDFIVFLANGTYMRSLENNTTNHSPYTIDYTGNTLDDIDRQKFYVSYINQNPAQIYSDLPDKDKEEYFHFCTTIEMMIYSHVWESTWLLKLLKQLANLIEGKTYDWKIEDMISQFDLKRHEFIRKEIKEIFRNYHLRIADIMDSSYHSQIRNAFAHSDFSFGMPGAKDKILLLNYKPETKPGKANWQIPHLSFDEWHERFALTINLAHFILGKVRKSRLGLVEGDYNILWPNHNDGNNLINQLIRYNPEADSFRFL